MSKKYYPEIDGLRAVAVLCVLLFHLNPKGIVPGGYIGVDVFFVISGYLITGIIFKDMQEGTFNYFQFLGRRIARLYPALLFMVFLILVAGFLIYDTSNYVYTAKIVRYALFSVSNLKLMQQAGYWDISSTDNPVLHTWSLGVEQQFYLLFPIIIYFVYKRFRTESSVVNALIIVSIISFVCAQVLSQSKPSANFYFTGSRLFELGIGGIFALIGDVHKNISNEKKEILFSLGLMIILSCAVLYINDIQYHPGVTTLPLIAASILCILFSDAKYTGYILRNNASVYLGKISYSIYLIHWPLIVFYQFLIQKSVLTSTAQLILFLVTLVISGIMYRFVENKYRRISLSFFSKTGKIFASIFILLFVLNYAVYASKGLAWRLIPYPKDVQEFSLYAGDLKEYLPWREMQKIGVAVKKPIAIFVGDSYLGQYVEQIDLYFKRKNQSVLFMGTPGCTETHIYWDDYESCRRNTERYYESLKTQLPVIRINSWSTIFKVAAEGKLFNEDLRSKDVSPHDIFNEIVSQQEKGKNNVLFILPPPLFTKQNSPLGKAPIYEFFPIELSETMQYKSDIDRVNANNTMIQFINEQTSMEYIETYNLFCKDSFCRNIDLSSGIFYYYDYGHLSRYGAKLVWDKIGDQVYDFILRNNPDVKSE